MEQLIQPFSVKMTFVHCFMQLGLGVTKEKNQRQFLSFVS
jgi:hypothetical protein